MQTESEFKPNNSKGWAAGLRNLIGEEINRWWSLKPLATQLMLWLVIINGYLALNLADYCKYFPAAEGPVNLSMMYFFNFSAIVMALGAAIFAHRSMAGERTSGTAAWLLSKPLSRKAFVISKLLANSVSFFIIIVLAQGIIAYAQLSFALGKPLPLIPFFGGIFILGVGSIFIMVLSIVLGTFTTSRSLTLGIPLFLAIGGPLAMGALMLETGTELTRYGPTTMAMVIEQAPYPVITAMPLFFIAIMVVISAAAIWKFDRTEV